MDYVQLLLNTLQRLSPWSSEHAKQDPRPDGEKQNNNNEGEKKQCPSTLVGQGESGQSDVIIDPNRGVASPPGHTHSIEKLSD